VRPLLALKVDVDTWRGTVEGVPNLVRILAAHEARATFLFSLGPDHTGWALRRALRPGFARKVARTSVFRHYGLATLLYGTLLPAPDIGLRGALHMRAAAQAGFECGVHAWDHVQWQDRVRSRDGDWTVRMMRQAWRRFADVFGVAPTTHGAAGWQMNPHAFAEHEAAGLIYASDARAPLREDGALFDPACGACRLPGTRCIQLPTTLPTLDELLGRSIGGKTLRAADLAPHLLALTGQARRDHLFTLHAELEGGALAPIFEQLLSGWKAQGYQLACLADYYEKVKYAPLPECPASWGAVPGRSGQLIVLETTP